MKNLIIQKSVVFLTAAFLIGTSTFAVANIVEKQPMTKAMYVAMLWDKMLGNVPDFTKWVEKSSVYQNTPLDQQAAMIAERAPLLNNIFLQMDIAKPLVVDLEIKPGTYNPNKGLLPLGITSKTFFAYGYLDKKYAIIPNGIDRYAQVKMQAKEAKFIAYEASNNKGIVKATFTLDAERADPKPLTMGKTDYNLILANITKIEIWTNDEKTLIWDVAVANRGDSIKGQLLNLYQ